jgi:hypothetical protein
MNVRLLAVSLVLALAFVFVSHQQQPAPQHHEVREKQPQSAIAPTTPFSVTAQIGHPAAAPRQDRTQSEPHDSLCEHLLNALVSNWPLVAIGIPGVWLALRTLKAIERQADLTHTEIALSHRPWVAVDVKVASPLIFDQRGAVLMLAVTMKNVGHSVAQNVSLWTDFAVGGVHEWTQRQKELCNIMKQPQNENSDYGWLLFPDQTTVESRPLIARPDDINKALETGPWKDSGSIGLHLVGCVDYQPSFDLRKHHQTKFVYLLGVVDLNTNTIMGIFDPKKATHSVILTATMHGMSAD